jgi:LysM repeat protein
MTSTSASVPATRPAIPATGVVCPYLLAADGGWRASTPTRAHRCTAVAPAAVLAPEKQRRLCLVADHASCATYLAASDRTRDLEYATGRHGRSSGRAAGSRPITRTAPLVLDHGRMSISVRSLRGERWFAQWALIGLMGLAFGAIVLARISMTDGPGAGGQLLGGAGATPSATIRATAGPTEAPIAATTAPQRTLVPTEVDPTASAAPSATATAAPSAASAAPSAAPATYKVKSGDTLFGIAAEFGTTWQAIAELNGLEDPGRLHVGQVLKLP